MLTQLPSDCQARVPFIENTAVVRHPRGLLFRLSPAPFPEEKAFVADLGRSGLLPPSGNASARAWHALRRGVLAGTVSLSQAGASDTVSGFWAAVSGSAE